MSRMKKSRSMKGKLGKTGTKEMLKEQKKKHVRRLLLRALMPRKLSKEKSKLNVS